MALAQAGKVTLHTRTYPLDAAPDALADLDAGRFGAGPILASREPPHPPGPPRLPPPPSPAHPPPAQPHCPHHSPLPASVVTNRTRCRHRVL